MNDGIIELPSGPVLVGVVDICQSCHSAGIAGTAQGWLIGWRPMPGAPMRPVFVPMDPSDRDLDQTPIDWHEGCGDAEHEPPHLFVEFLDMSLEQNDQQLKDMATRVADAFGKHGP